MWLHGLGGVFWMGSSPFPPNIMVRYLIITPPGHLDPSYFGRKFERFFKFRHILVNTKVNKCWPKCFFRKDHIKSYRKHIYSFFIALILFSQSLKVCLSLLNRPLLNLTFICNVGVYLKGTSQFWFTGSIYLFCFNLM